MQEFERADVEGCGEISLEALKKVLQGSVHIGSLTEDEIEAIFSSIVVGTGDTIHYHEFIAACLSQVKVDERNLRLAFDRLDTERDGGEFRLWIGNRVTSPTYRR